MRTITSILVAWLALPVLAEATNPTPIPIQNAITKLIREIDVPAQVPGVLTEVIVREGDRVTKNQVIARIGHQKVQLELKRSEIELETAAAKAMNDLAVRDAELAMAVANNELSRVLSANRRNPNTYRTAEVERYQLLADRSKLQVQQAKHEQNVRKLDESLARNRLEAAADSLAQHEVKAPWDGMVVAVNAHAGKWVDPGSEIVRMIDPTHLRIEGFVSSEFTVESLIGAKTEVEFGGPGTATQTLTGHVVFVSPDVNPVNLLARIFVEVENRNGLLRPGSTVRANVLPPAEALMLPDKAHQEIDGPQ